MVLVNPRRTGSKPRVQEALCCWLSEPEESPTPFHRLSHELIKKFGLMLKEFCPCNNQTWVLVNGVRQRSGAVQADPGLLGYSVRADEVGKTAEQLFDASLRKVRQNEGKPSSLRATLQKHPQGLLVPQGRALSQPQIHECRKPTPDWLLLASLPLVTLSHVSHWLFRECILRPQTSLHIQTCTE